MTNTALQVGEMVNVYGRIDTIDGERAITEPLIVEHIGNLSEEDLPSPLAMRNGSIGGSAFNSYTPSIHNAIGLNNTGLLVKTFGEVIEVGDEYFYIDDGSALHDWPCQFGLKVDCTGLTSPHTHDYVCVTGISATGIVQGDIHRLLRPRQQSDIVIVRHNF